MLARISIALPNLRNACPVNRPIANQSSWEYARASPPLPGALPIVLCGRVDLRGCRIARIRRRRNLMSADNKALVRRLYEEVWNKRRLELVDEIISPSHALHDPNLTDSSVGPDAYRRQVSRFIVGIPDLRFTIEDIVDEKEKVAVAWTISGTHTGEFMGIPATNKKVYVEGITNNNEAAHSRDPSDNGRDRLARLSDFFGARWCARKCARGLDSRRA